MQRPEVKESCHIVGIARRPVRPAHVNTAESGVDKSEEVAKKKHIGLSASNS